MKKRGINEREIKHVAHNIEFHFQLLVAGWSMLKIAKFKSELLPDSGGASRVPARHWLE